MNLHFTFSIREISQVRDSEQRLKIPMYFSVEWEVSERGREGGREGAHRLSFVGGRGGRDIYLKCI